MQTSVVPDVARRSYAPPRLVCLKPPRDLRMARLLERAQRWRADLIDADVGGPIAAMPAGPKRSAVPWGPELDVRADILEEFYCAGLRRHTGDRRYRWPLYDEHHAETALTAAWRSASDTRRRQLLQDWCNEQLRKRLGTQWKPAWTAIYVRPPPDILLGRHSGARGLARRSALVWWLDRQPPFALPLVSAGTGLSSRFLSEEEFVWISIVSGNWPERMAHEKVAKGYEMVLAAEREAIKKAIAAYGYLTAPATPLRRGPQERLEKFPQLHAT